MRIRNNLIHILFYQGSNIKIKDNKLYKNRVAKFYKMDERREWYYNIYIRRFYYTKRVLLSNRYFSRTVERKKETILNIHYTNVSLNREKRDGTIA